MQKFFLRLFDKLFDLFVLGLKKKKKKNVIIKPSFRIGITVTRDITRLINIDIERSSREINGEFKVSILFFERESNEIITFIEEICVYVFEIYMSC